MINQTVQPINSQLAPTISIPLVRLDALTSLRFFAAAMIVIFHSLELFFPGETLSKTWRLNQGVTFFFVLSGFILTYVHPRLEGLDQIKQFLVARLSRIWPSHLLTAGLTLWLLPGYCPNASILWTNLLLLQAWIPNPAYYFSINSVSWSISVEVFFYICFIALIQPWRAGWLGKLAVGFTLALICCIIADFSIFSNIRNLSGLSPYFLLYINPLARLTEFILGMVTAKLWLHFGRIISLNKWQTTFFEALAVSAVLINIIQLNNIALIFEPLLKQCSSFSFWLLDSGTAPLFCLLIFIIATKKGYLSQALTHPILIWLGEISYSIYLVHYLLRQYFTIYIPELARINNWLGYSVYLALVILFAHLNFCLIESPCRKLINKFASSRNFFVAFAHFFNQLHGNARSAFIAAVLTAVVATITIFYMDKAQARFSFSDIAIGRNVRFEDKLILEKVRVATASDGSKMQLTWRSLTRQHLNSLVIIQLHDSQESLLVQHTYHQSLFNQSIHAGQLWTEEVYIPSTENKNIDHIGLSILSHHPERLLSIESSYTENSHCRLIIPISQKNLVYKNNK